MADEEDSKSFGGNIVWVQVPPPAFFHFQLISDTWSVIAGPVSFLFLLEFHFKHITVVAHGYKMLCGGIPV